MVLGVGGSDVADLEVGWKNCLSFSQMWRWIGKGSPPTIISSIPIHLLRCTTINPAAAITNLLPPSLPAHRRRHRHQPLSRSPAPVSG